MSRISKEESIKTAQNQCLKLLLEFDSICRENNLTYWLDGGTLLGAKRHEGFIPWDDDVDLCLPISDYLSILGILEKQTQSDANRMLYFHNSEYTSWLDYYGDTTLLTDALFPVRIDLLPVKYIKNNEDEIRIDRSLTEVATLYMRGKMKNPDAVIDSHKKWLPESTENLNLQKERFLKFYFDYASKTSTEAKDEPDFLVNYIFNDAYVKSTRPYYKSAWVFPLVHRQNFENVNLSQPNDIDAYLTLLYGENHMELPPENKRVTHLKYLIENRTLARKHIRQFIVDLYLLRFKTYNLYGSKSSTLNKLAHYFSFTLHLVFKGKIRFAKRFWRFNWLHRGEI